MRIAIVTPGGVDRTGEHRVIPALLALLERLSRCNDVQVIALLQEDHASEWHLCGAHVHNIGSPRTGLRALSKLYRLHRDRPFDVVHAFWAGTSGLIAALAGKFLGIPSLIHVAGGELSSIPDIGYGGAQTWRGRTREPLVLRSVSAVTAASAPIIESMRQLRIAAHRVPLGVDLHKWPVRNPVRRDQNRPARFVHVASLNLVKDQFTLLRTMHALLGAGLQFELDIIGEDTLRGELQKMTKELGLLQFIRFRGFVAQAAMRPIIEAADLMIVTSRHEAGPLVVLEAAVAGVPTVGTAVGHIVEWAPRAAQAVAVGDWAGLAASIRQVLGDEDMRLRMATEALKLAVMEDADFTARSFSSLYAHLV